MSETGKLFVISGPSGVGKSTVLDYLMEEKEVDLIYSISATTRKPRLEEEDGKDYYFLSEKEFLQKKEKGEFLETATVHNHYYGTPRKNVQENLKKGNSIILEIDIQGARQIKNKFPRAVFIFLEPPSFSELKHRLDKRDSEAKDDKKLRLNNAREELEAREIFDYTVVNKNIEKAACELEKIILKECQKEE